MISTPQAPQVNTNRWVIALAGVVIQIMLGTVYAWSVFKKPIYTSHQGWTEFQVGLTFALTIFFLGFSAAIGGRLVDKAGSRMVATVGGLLFGLGTLLAGYAHQAGHLWLLWLGYGVITGIGNGLGYVTPVAVLARWFPDKKGFITGLAVMGFGLGAAFMSLLGPWLIKQWGNDVGVYRTFYICGAAFLVLIPLAARKLVNPPAGYTVAGMAGKTTKAPIIQFEPAQALRTNQFYILWGILFFNVAAGIALLSNMSPMAQKNLSIDPKAAALIVLIGSFCNGFGRVFWGGLSEKIGRRNVFLLLFITQIPLFILLPHITAEFGGTTAFAIIAGYIMLCYGGGFGTMPSFTADTFGSKNMGAIYGMVLFAWGVAGGVGPMLMEAIKKATGNFSAAIYIAAGLLAVGFILTMLYRRPKVDSDENSQTKFNLKIPSPSKRLEAAVVGLFRDRREAAPR